MNLGNSALESVENEIEIAEDLQQCKTSEAGVNRINQNRGHNWFLETASEKAILRSMTHLRVSYYVKINFTTYILNTSSIPVDSIMT